MISMTLTVYVVNRTPESILYCTNTVIREDYKKKTPFKRNSLHVISFIVI